MMNTYRNKDTLTDVLQMLQTIKTKVLKFFKAKVTKELLK